MNKILTIYHGSREIMETPTFGKGRKNNDFGLGFYCTESDNLAKEWAISSNNDGFSNCYLLLVRYKILEYIKVELFELFYTKLDGDTC